MHDYLEGVDPVPEREVIDFKTNSYGGLLCEFLISTNCCILNGRNTLVNDFTSVPKSARGAAVVDYCLVPAEYLDSFSEFSVIRARQF